VGKFEEEFVDAGVGLEVSMCFSGVEEEEGGVEDSDGVVKLIEGDKKLSGAIDNARRVAWEGVETGRGAGVLIWKILSKAYFERPQCGRTKIQSW